jgi:hypothetical protein
MFYAVPVAEWRRDALFRDQEKYRGLSQSHRADSKAGLERDSCPKCLKFEATILSATFPTTHAPADEGRRPTPARRASGRPETESP